MRRALAIVGALVLAIIVCACDVGKHGKGTVFGPTAHAPLPATIGVPNVPFVSPFVCVSPFTTAFDLTLSASRTIDLQQLTVQLGDGSNAGGPSVLIPRSDLTARFESALVSAGTSRRFGFNAVFGCPEALPFMIIADIGFIDVSTGQAMATRVSASLR